MPIGVPQLCDFCKKEFIPKRNNARYCCRKCNDDYRNSMKPRKTNKSYHKANELKKESLTETELQIVYGSIFGDGSLVKISSGYRFSLCHSDKQFDYLTWKKNHCPHLFLAEPKRYENQYREQATIQYHLHSISHPQLNDIYHAFYENKKIVVDYERLDHLGPLGLAVWFMDDGSYNKHPNSMQAFLCTDSLSKDENETIIAWFQDRYGIECKLQYMNYGGNYGNSDTYRIRINRTQTEKFFSIIRPHMCESMLYKIR